MLKIIRILGGFFFAEGLILFAWLAMIPTENSSFCRFVLLPSLTKGHSYEKMGLPARALDRA
jgi:hypothetical protein